MPTRPLHYMYNFAYDLYIKTKHKTTNIYNIIFVMFIVFLTILLKVRDVEYMGLHSAIFNTPMTKEA